MTHPYSPDGLYCACGLPEANRAHGLTLADAQIPLVVETVVPKDLGSDNQARFALKREFQSVEIVARFSIPGEPVSKARARFTNQGSKVRTFTPEKTKQAEERIGWAFKKAAPRHRVDSESSFGVFGVFFAGTRQRRDVDNMVKLVCDALTGIAWADDSQVEEISGRRGSDLPEHARTEILVYRCGLVSKRTRNCVHCGQPFPTYPSLPQTKHCSQACLSAARLEARMRNCEHCGVRFDAVAHERARKFCSAKCRGEASRVLVPCTHCGKEFYQPGYRRGANYCSPECQATAMNTRRRSMSRGTCEVCGGSVTRTEYRRCDPCKRRGPKSLGEAS